MLLRLIIFRLQKFLPIFPYSLPLLIMFPRLQEPMCNSCLLRTHLRDVTLLPHTVTDITLSRWRPYWHPRFRSRYQAQRWAKIQFWGARNCVKWKYKSTDVSKNTAATTPQGSHGLQELASSISSYSTTTLVLAQQSAQRQIPEEWELQFTLHPYLF